MHPPCKNPNCKSVGQPHPNCRCYGDMADGGEVAHFCSQDREHDSQCEYFAEGGDAINPNEVVLDAAPPAHEEINPADVQIDPEINPDEVQIDSPSDGKYAGTAQTTAAGLEGAAQGIVGPLAPYAEMKLGISTPEDIAGRQKAHSYVHGAAEAGALAASMLVGTGEAGLIAKGAKFLVPAVEEGRLLAQTGAKMLNGFIQGASFAGSDEITKSLLGQKDANPSDTVGTALLHMGANGLINGLTNGIFNIVPHALTDSVAAKVGAKAEKFLADLADDGKPVSKALMKAITVGASLHNAKTGSDVFSELERGGATYGMIKKLIEPWLSKVIDKPLTKANNYVTDAIISTLLKENTKSIPTAIQWGQALTKGSKSYLPGIEAIFNAGSSQIAPKAADQLHQELKDNIEEGTPQLQMEKQLQTDGAGPQTFAHGGKVEPPSMNEPDHFGAQFPEQNVLMNQAKGRIYGYLNSLRPLPNPMKAPFDKPAPDRDKHREYDRAISLAVNPLKILDHVNKGNLTPDDMKHFTALYPEVHSLLSKKITERMLKAQLSGERPPFKKRQAMSLFLGSTLDGCLTPQAIQAAQGVFASKQASQPQPSQAKGKALSKASDAYKTGSQSRQERQQKV